MAAAGATGRGEPVLAGTWAVFDALPVGAFAVSPDGRVVYANPALHDLLGYEPGTLVGLAVAVFREDGPCVLPVPNREARYKRRDGGVVWVSEGAARLPAAELADLDVRVATDVTGYRRMAGSLRDQLLMKEVLFETLPVPVFLKDRGGRYTDCNEAFERFTGLPRASLIERTPFAVMDERTAAVHAAMDSDLVVNWGQRTYEEEVPHADGTNRVARISKAAFRDHSGMVGGIVGVIHDLSEGVPDAARLQTILEQSPIGVSVSRRDTGNIIFANTRFAELVGLPRNQIVGSPARTFYVDAQQRARVVQRLKDSGSVVNMEVQFRRADGSSFWTLFTVNQAVIEGVHVNLAWIYDYTERRNMEEALRDMASKDPLTGIYNRRSFMELASRQLARASRKAEAMSVMVLDVDHFKRVNDTYGHGVGDDALRMVASTCSTVLREYDILGRLGGEEFVIALPGAAPGEAAVVAERVRRHIARMPIATPDGVFTLTASIGIASVDGANDSLEKAIHRADLALYRAKHGGRNRVTVYEHGI